jgi:hypothetical protein
LKRKSAFAAFRVNADIPSRKRSWKRGKLHQRIAMTIIGLIICAMFLIAVWRVSIQDEISK